MKLMIFNKKITLIIFLILALSTVFTVGYFVVSKKIYSYYLRSKYPLKYQEHILKYSKEFKLDPYLVTAVIYEESRFRPDSNSAKGARGLMQLLPETGEYIAEKIDDKEFGDQNLNHVEKNIKFGCYYLSYLINKYNDLEKVLAAYNAGEGNVDSWIKSGNFFSIEFQETKDFVRKVQETREKYMFLYPELFIE